MERVSKEIWYRRSHITGPSAVLVSLRFGTAPDSGPAVQRLPRGDDATIKFDLQSYVAEVLAGVDAANKEFSGALEVEAIQIVPDDYPHEGQARYVAYLIAKLVITGSE